MVRIAPLMLAPVIYELAGFKFDGHGKCVLSNMVSRIRIFNHSFSPAWCTPDPAYLLPHPCISLVNWEGVQHSLPMECNDTTWKNKWYPWAHAAATCSYTGDAFRRKLKECLENHNGKSRDDYFFAKHSPYPRPALIGYQKAYRVFCMLRQIFVRETTHICARPPHQGWNIFQHMVDIFIEGCAGFLNVCLLVCTSKWSLFQANLQPYNVTKWQSLENILHPCYWIIHVCNAP